jgi:hypothetical protein
MWTNSSRTRALWGALLVLCALPVAGRAGALGGAVRDASGAPVSGVRIDASGGLPSTLTDAAGRWAIVADAVAEGAAFSVSAARAGYQVTPSSQHVVVSNGGATADFTATPLRLGAVPALAVSGYSVAPATTVLGIATPMLKAYLAASGDTVSISAFKFANLGGADPTKVTVSLAVGSAVLTSACAYDAQTQLWTVTLTTPYVMAAGKGLYFTVRLSSTDPGQTLKVSLPDAAAIVSTAGVSGRFPLVSGTTTAQAGLAVSGYSTAPASMSAGVVTPMLKVLAQAQGMDVYLDALKLRALGSADPTRLTPSLAVGSTVLATTTTYDGVSRTWTLTLTTPYKVKAGTSLYFTPRISSAQTGVTVQVSVPDLASVVTAAPVGGTAPITSSLATIAPDVNVTGFSAAPASVAANASADVLKIRFEAPLVDVTISAIRLADLGDIASGSVTLSLAAGSLALPCTPTYDGVAKVWTLTLVAPYTLRAGSAIYWTVKARSSAGGVLQLSLTDPTSVLTASSVGGTFPLLSTAMTVLPPPELQVTATNLAGTTLTAALPTWTPLLLVRLTALSTNVTVTGLVVRDVGTVVPDSITLALYQGVANITPAGTTYDDTTKTWTLPLTTPIAITAGNFVDLALNVKVNRDAIGDTVRLRLADATSVTVQGAAPVTGSFPLLSNATTVIAPPMLTVTATDVAPYSVASSTIVWTPMLRLGLAASGGAVTVTGLVVSDAGTIDAADVGLRVYNGAANITGTPVFNAGTKTWTITFSTPVAITSGNAATLELRQQGAAPANLKTMQVQVADATAFTTAAFTDVTGAFAMVSAPTVIAAASARLWLRQFGTSGDDNVHGVAADAQGNVYVCGSTSGALSGTNAGGLDAFLAKYDKYGALVWVRQLGTSADEEARGVSLDSSGYVYIAGWTAGRLGAAQVGTDPYYPTETEDVFVARYDASGTQLWLLQTGTKRNDRANGIAVDPAGSIFVAGSTYGDWYTANAGGADAYWLRLDKNGGYVVMRQLGSPEDDIAYGVSLHVPASTVNAVFMVGSTAAATGGVGGNGTLDGQDKAGGLDGFIARYEGTGGTARTRLIKTALDDVALGVTGLANGEAYVTGYTAGALPGMTALGGLDAFLVKSKSDGTLIYVSQFGTTADDAGQAITRDASNAIYVAGYTAGDYHGTSFGLKDVFVTKWTGGALTWRSQYGTTEDDAGTGIAIDGSGYCYVGGTTLGDLEQGVTNFGLLDGWVSKHAP